MGSFRLLWVYCGYLVPDVVDGYSQNHKIWTILALLPCPRGPFIVWHNRTLRALLA